jgi:hypothetical protein
MTMFWLGLCLGVMLGVASARALPDWGRLTPAQQKQISDALHERVPLWQKAIPLLIVCIGFPLCVWLTAQSSPEALVGALLILAAVEAPFALIVIRSCQRVFREEMARMPETLVNHDGP